jgi:radical SAM protein with 4Fe4S-binding SPASM domain
MMNLELYLTTNCQMDCSFCGAWYRSGATPQIPFETACEILDVAAESGYRFLALSGGEPFLHRDLAEITKYATARGFYVSIFTNGLLIDKKRLDAFGSTAVNIRVSLHTLDRDRHARITGSDTLPRVLSAIQQLRERGMYFSLAATIYDINLHDIGSLADFAVENGAASIRFTPVFGLYHGSNIQLDEDFYVCMLREVVESSLRHQEHLDYHKQRQPNSFAAEYMKILATRRCSAGTRLYSGVDSSLQVIPCPVIPSDDALPSATYDSMAGIQAFNAEFERLFDDPFVQQLEGRCAICPYKGVCKGGCLATKLASGRRPTDEQPICMLAIYYRVMASFDPSETAELLHYWQYRYDKMSAGTDGDKGCIRKFPIWQLDFQHDRLDAPAFSTYRKDAVNVRSRSEP